MNFRRDEMLLLLLLLPPSCRTRWDTAAAFLPDETRYCCCLLAGREEMLLLSSCRTRWDDAAVLPDETRWCRLLAGRDEMIPPSCRTRRDDAAFLPDETRCCRLLLRRRSWLLSNLMSKKHSTTFHRHWLWVHTHFEVFRPPKNSHPSPVALEYFPTEGSLKLNTISTLHFSPSYTTHCLCRIPHSLKCISKTSPASPLNENFNYFRSILEQVHRLGQNLHFF